MKLGAAFTLRLTVVVLVKLPELPLIVTMNVPPVAVSFADSVSVLVARVPPGLNEAVTPPGNPDADKLTIPEKPPIAVTVTVLVPVAPCTRVTLLGEAERAKP